MGCISAYAIYSGGASRLIYGMDSFGNICGQKNQPVGSHSYHGLDMTNRKFVYFFDFTAEAAELVSRKIFKIKFLSYLKIIYSRRKILFVASLNKAKISIFNFVFRLPK